MKKMLLTFVTALVALSFLVGCMPNYSNGDRVGVVNKVSHKGMIWKDYSVQVNLGGLKQTTIDEHQTYVANVWNASTRDPLIAKQLEDAAFSGQPVRITYRQWLLNPPSTSSDYIVVKVEPIQQ